MDIFGIGIPELLVILVLAMVAVGPEKMVEYAGKAGKWFAQFRRETSEVTREFKDALDGAVEDAEIEESSKKNTTPTQWRFTPTQFAVPDKKASATASVSAGSKKAAVPVRDDSDKEAIALLESLSDEQGEATSAAPIADSSTELDSVTPEPVDEVLAAAAAETAAASRSARPKPAASTPASKPKPIPQPVSVPPSDISDLLGSAFSMDKEPAKEEPKSPAEPQTVVEEPAPEPLTQTPPPETQTSEKAASSTAKESTDPLDLLGDALSFSFGDDEDEGGR